MTNKPTERVPAFTLTRKDFRIDWYSGTGPGGQNRNKVQACCRITHIETGLTAQGTSHRQRSKNQRDAFYALAERLTPWLEKKVLGERPVFNEREDTIRTYHIADNRVKDHASGFKQTWDEVYKDLSQQIDARRAALVKPEPTEEG